MEREKEINEKYVCLRVCVRERNGMEERGEEDKNERDTNTYRERV